MEDAATISMAKQPRGRQAVAYGAVALVAAIFFVPHVLAGGWLGDDWWTEETAHFHGMGGVVDALMHNAPTRPLQAVYLGLVHTVLGGSPHWQLALVAVQRLVLSLLILTSLRQFGFDLLMSVGAAVSIVLFPFSDSTWLWVTGGVMSLCVLLWLAGLLAALKGLRQESRAYRWHALAVVLYVASFLDYELGALVIVMTGLVYLAKAPRREALYRWATDVVAVCLTAVLVFAVGNSQHRTLGFHESIEHARLIASQARVFLARSLAPFGSIPSIAILAGWVVVVAAGCIVAGASANSRTRTEARRWLKLTAVGTLIAVCGWGVLVPARVDYVPLLKGPGNRIDLIAGIGVVLIVVAGLSLTRLLILDAWKQAPVWIAPGLALAAVGAVGAGYAHLTVKDRTLYQRASRAQANVLAAIQRSIPPLSGRGATIIVAGFSLYADPRLQVPVFAAAWDLDSAVKMLRNDLSLTAWPLSGGRALVCGTQRVTVSSIGIGVAYPPGPNAGRYGQTQIVDVKGRWRATIGGQATCRRFAEQVPTSPRSAPTVSATRDTFKTSLVGRSRTRLCTRTGVWRGQSGEVIATD
jgi:hypothetical protein